MKASGMRREGRKSTPSKRVGTWLLAAGAGVLLALVLFATFSFSGGYAASGMVPRPADRTSSARATHDGEDAADASVDWDYWRGVNPDVIGWLEVPDTGISLPVVKASRNDPTYYLSHDVYGNWNYHGCPYLDADCPAGLDSENAIILGHNLIDRTMFTELERYHDEAFASAHRKLVIYTPNGTRLMEIAGCETVAGSEHIKRTEFADEDDFRSYAEERLSACAVRFPDQQIGNRMVTLCTCSYFFNPENERTLIYAF